MTNISYLLLFGGIMIFNAYSDSPLGLFGISLNSSGHIFAQSGRSISRPFGRNDWLLFYVAKGSERFSLSGDEIAKEGSFVIFKPGERQEHIQTGEKTAEFYYAHFNAPEDFEPFGFETSQIYGAKPSTKIRDIFEEIIAELQTKRHGYEKICVAKLLLIFGELERRVAKESDPNRAYADKISFVIQLMNREYNAEHSLSDYADICKMSKFHFLRVFKEITGCSPVEYKNKIRMEHAKELLEDTNTPVGEIGLQVGFSSATYFCDAFKKKYGISPSQYRKEKK